MADHKIYGNNGAGNVQAPERIWASNRTNGNCVVSFTSRSEEYSIEYIRAVVAASQLAAANARADHARDKALVKALSACKQVAETAREYNIPQMVMGANKCHDDISDLRIQAHAILALRDKPAPALYGWQPIETAPKDGFFLVCAHPPSVSCEFDVSVSVVWNGRGGVSLNAYYDADGIEMPYLDGPATHWMPLPAPPEA